MKYALIPKVRFKRGTKRRRRRIVRLLQENIWFARGAEIQEAFDKAARECLINGSSAVKVSWDGGHPVIENVNYPE